MSNLFELLDDPEEARSAEGPSLALAPPSEATPARLTAAHPPLEDPVAVRARAAELLSALDPALLASLPDPLPFPPEDDPFTRTADEWEAEWYARRESAQRVYWNMRMEFRRHLERAVAGEPSDLAPWTLWVFRAPRPQDGEPVYGVTPERRAELGWDYPGPATDFRIYRESAPE